MFQRLLPAGGVRRALLAGGLLVAGGLGFAVLRGWELNLRPQDETDFTKPASVPSFEERQAQWAEADKARVAAALGPREEAEAATAERVRRLIVEMNAPDGATRERADLALRNLPVSAAPLVAAAYEEEGDAMDPEPRARLGRSVQMFQALSAIEERRRKYTDWLRSALLAAYNAYGDRSPAWDEAAKEFVILAAEPDWDEAHPAKVRTAMDRVLGAECRDPLVLFYALVLKSREPSADETVIVREAVAIGNAMSRSEYPFWIKVNAIARCAGTAEQLQRGMNQLAKVHVGGVRGEAARAFLGADPDERDAVPDPLLYEVARNAYWANSEHEIEMARFAEIFRKYETLAGPASHYLPLFKGSCYLQRANDRTMYTVRKPEHRVDFGAERRRHLEVAEQSLAQAHRMAPDDVSVALEIMKLKFEQGNDEEGEHWFRRVMALNPDHLQACQIRCDQLPGDERLEFVRELAKQQNYRGQLPFVLVDLHAQRADWSGEKETYFERPGVWEDVSAVYTGYLELFPKDVLVRSKYARYANRCRHWAEADRQFKILGDNPALRVFGSMTSYNYHRKKAARNASATLRQATGE
jgi:hypothetical protein